MLLVVSVRHRKCFHLICVCKTQKYTRYKFRLAFSVHSFEKRWKNPKWGKQNERKRKKKQQLSAAQVRERKRSFCKSPESVYLCEITTNLLDLRSNPLRTVWLSSYMYLYIFRDYLWKMAFWSVSYIMYKYCKRIWFECIKVWRAHELRYRCVCVSVCLSVCVLPPNLASYIDVKRQDSVVVCCKMLATQHSHINIFLTLTL